MNEAATDIDRKPPRDWLARPPLCPYCKSPARLVTGDVVYSDVVFSSVVDALFWQCAPCDAHVGTHRNSRRCTPLGTLANKELRRWRMKVHALLDPLWKSGKMTRPDAYAWLAQRMGKPVDRTHVGYFRDAECMAAILALEARFGSERVAAARLNRDRR